VEGGHLDNHRQRRNALRKMKEDPAVGTSRQRAIVTLLLVIFVLCTAPYYLGFRPFGEATKVFKAASFVALLAALYLFGAFRRSDNR
jgi:hypothetical protein